MKIFNVFKYVKLLYFYTKIIKDSLRLFTLGLKLYCAALDIAFYKFN
jgi:hypothetical protein